jgi:hypothetical protein
VGTGKNTPKFPDPGSKSKLIHATQLAEISDSIQQNIIVRSCHYGKNVLSEKKISSFKIKYYKKLYILVTWDVV